MATHPVRGVKLLTVTETERPKMSTLAMLPALSESAITKPGSPSTEFWGRVQPDGISKTSRLLARKLVAPAV
jgi:hypothetical protein